MKKKTKKRVRYIYRSAKTGRIITYKSARRRDPATVVRERVGKG